MASSMPKTRFSFLLWLIRVIGVIVPLRLRADQRQKWETEFGLAPSCVAKSSRCARNASGVVRILRRTKWTGG